MKDCKWRDIKVGQILEVRDNENFPADLLCLACARADGVAYIRTTNLDGDFPALFTPAMLHMNSLWACFMPDLFQPPSRFKQS